MSEIVFVEPADIVAALPAHCRIVIDEAVASAWPQLSPEGAILIPSGEQSKTWEQAGRVVEQLALSGLKRSGTVAAIGGGVAGDLAGFAAASYMRGVRLFQVPTTLLAMVDSSIGGKVGVDLRAGKNLAGAFWPAERILAAPALLDTLPQREWLCGAAEVWKYGAIMDLSLWETLEQEPVSPSCSHLLGTIQTCMAHKQRVVEEDPYERTGLRAILNFGHTIGHAIEWLLGYQVLTHGEAISIGMVLEAQLGERLGVTVPGTAERLQAGLESQGLPTALPPGLNPALLLEAMGRDKKAGTDGLGMSLLEHIGACKLTTGIQADAVMGVLAKK